MYFYSNCINSPGYSISEFDTVILCKTIRCAKNALMRSFSGPYFPEFGLITEIYETTDHRKLHIWTYFAQ